MGPRAEIKKNWFMLIYCQHTDSYIFYIRTKNKPFNDNMKNIIDKSDTNYYLKGNVCSILQINKWTMKITVK